MATMLRDAEHIETVTVTIEPSVPDCDDDHSEHEWEDDGREGFGAVVTGHGGCVVLQHRCTHCGIVRITDTWAQRRDTGEQGLESVRYTSVEVG
jgi:hypothetical protein